MHIETTRFGSLELDEQKIIHFPQGLIGFPEEKSFVMINHRGLDTLAWLQSTRSPAIALPVVGVQAFAPHYPDVSLEDAARRAGLDGGPDDMAALVVLCATPNAPVTVNLVAPIIVNALTWTGVQTILEGTKFTTREVFVMPKAPAKAPVAHVSP
ncbi:MAG TPA: flagellar assembly protein FliW [Polyangiaceae bacterium]|nr:flagellar assembly protein FliW [Polyangiaceae bacterium]